MSDDYQAIRAAVLAEAQRPVVTGPWLRDVAWLELVHLAVAAAALVVAALGWNHVPAVRGASLWLLLLSVGSGVVATVAVGSMARWWTAVTATAAVAGIVMHVTGYSLVSSAPFFADADCALAELAIAAVPAMVTIATLRRFAFQRGRAILGGVVAAMTGLLVLDLTCPADGIAHAVSFHVLPAVAVVALALLLRARVTSRSHVP